jgi:polar amino acid transport system substrate-binding protein
MTRLTRRLQRTGLALALVATLTSAGVALGAGPAGASQILGTVNPKAPLYNLVPAAIRKAGVLNVGTSVAYPPYDFSTANSTQVVGFDPDFDAALAKLFGIPFSLHVVQFSALVTGVEAGRYTVSLDGVTDTIARDKVDSFVDYGQAGLVILTATDHAKVATTLEALCGQTLAYAQGTYGEETAQDTTKYCKTKGKPGPIVKVYSDEPSIQLALRSGRVDYELQDTATGGYDVKKSDGQLALVPIKGFGASVYDGDFAVAPFGVVVPKNNKALETLFQKGFEALVANGQYAAIWKKWGESDLAITKFTIDKPIY